ncbi:MAG: hypothetical protein AAF713_15330 [Pseudomonadota bacterium]
MKLDFSAPHRAERCARRYSAEPARKFPRGLLVGCLVLATQLLSACADGIGKREPILFGDGRGSAFDVAGITVTGAEGARRAVLPQYPPSPVSEERVDISGTPVLGEVFKERLGPADIEDQGLPIGAVYRDGNTLRVDLGAQTLPERGRRFVLSSEIDRLGAISYRLGALLLRAVEARPIGGERIGYAYLLRDTIALVADGNRPPVRNLQDLLPSGL